MKKLCCVLSVLVFVALLVVACEGKEVLSDSCIAIFPIVMVLIWRLTR